MGSNCKLNKSLLQIIAAVLLLVFHFDARVSKKDVFVKKSESIAAKRDDTYYKKLVVDFFTSINCANVEFSQFKEDKKIGSGTINFDRSDNAQKYIKIESLIGRRKFLLTGASLDKIEFEDCYLEEKKIIKAPEIVKLLFGTENDVSKIIKDSQITVTDSEKLVCVIKYDDFTGEHKILLCFKLKPFVLTFWRVINRDQTTSYIKVDALRYNYKSS